MTNGQNIRIAAKLILLFTLLGFVVFLLEKNITKINKTHITTDLSSAEQKVGAVEEINNTPSLISYLRKEGVNVVIKDLVDLPNFKIPGLVTSSDGDSLIIYEYNTTDESKAASLLVMKKFAKFQAVSKLPLRYFRSGPVIVEYMGKNGNTLLVLINALGPQIAGK